MQQLIAWIAEREAIRVRREAGQPKPWTDDPILRAWRFCNIRRENDKVTRWIAQNWREPNAADPDLLFAMAVARLVNWPDTMAVLGYPVPFDGDHFITVLQARAAEGAKVWGEAYNISNAGKSLPKVEVVSSVLYGLMGAAQTTATQGGRHPPWLLCPPEGHGRLRILHGRASRCRYQVRRTTA